ncbi:MAG: cobyric acid synthase [Propionibacteriaceae bacterium]|nr:cobyric acid synthase [Propionibacteriaceae bacterium]
MSFLVAGTSSDAGKSLITAGLCRVARRRGINVVPFKAQNMSNNSMVVADGEIGRAQYLQAIAAGVTPSSVLNPVLLKPGSDRRAHVILRGQPAGELRAGEYATGRRHLAEAAFEAYRELAAQYDLVICEGAGSPAEINLREGDYTNMGLARQFGLPVVLVGDIDRGGVLASIYGTWGLLEGEDRGLLAGYLINKFRGDQAVLDPGLEEISRRTGLSNFGVLPWLPGMWVDGEDALEVARWRGEDLGGGGSTEGALTVAVVRMPRISNATDVDALAAEPGVRVTVTTDPEDVAAADLAVLPGSRATLTDLAWLRSTGIAAAVVARAQAGRPVLGICGGFQMLGRTVVDPVESGSPEPVDGLGLLPVSVEFSPDKVLGRPQGEWRGVPVEGYEIHHGRPTLLDGGDEGFLGGVRVGQTWGTMWHGALESDEFRRSWLAEIAKAAGREWVPSEAPGFAARREMMLDSVADALEEHADVTALLGLCKDGGTRS